MPTMSTPNALILFKKNVEFRGNIILPKLTFMAISQAEATLILIGTVLSEIISDATDDNFDLSPSAQIAVCVSNKYPITYIPQNQRGERQNHLQAKFALQDTLIQMAALLLIFSW